jgi:hypothetical protein
LHRVVNDTIYLGEVIAFKAREGVKPIVWLYNKYFALNEEVKQIRTLAQKARVLDIWLLEPAMVSARSLRAIQPSLSFAL